jgi:VCBS repeat-containing protein
VLAACGDGAIPPLTLQDLTVTTAEDTPVSITVPLTAAAPAAVALTVVTAPSHGTLAGQGPSWTYTPAADYNGSDTLTVRAEDSRGTATATVTITITAVDDAPVAHPDSVAAGFETPLTIAQTTLTANDTDIDSSVLTVTAVAAGTHGTVALSASDVVFTPETGFEGTATFVYTVSDGTRTAQGTVTVTIGADQAPVAVADTAVTDEDVALVIPDATLLANDSDPEHQTLAISAVGNASHGSVSHAGSQVTFVPDPDYHGAAAFDYTITDGYLTAIATVMITVNSVNDPPVATADTATTDEDTPLTLAAATLLANDTDADGDTLTMSAVTATANTHGTVTLASGVVTYTPAADFNGTADFSYTVSDGNGGTANGLVTVTVVAVDDAPVAVNDTATVLEDAAATAIAVLANDTDVDGGPKLIASVTTLTTRGTVVITGGGTGLTYAPSRNYCNAQPPSLAAHAQLGSPSPNAPAGPDRFTYTLSPGGSTATVSVTVTCVDDPPVAVNDVATVAEGSTGNAINVLANDTDVDGGLKAVASVTQPGHGTAAIGPSGLSVLYTPAGGYCNQAPNTPPDTFTYTLTPGGSSATVSLTVTCACGLNKSTDFVVGSNN